MAVLPGNVENPEARVIPRVTISAAGAGSLPAGSVTKALGFVGITQHDCDDGDVTGLVVDMIVRVPKKAGVGTALAPGDLIYFDVIGGAGADQDAYQAEEATSGVDPVEAICLETKVDADTDVKVRLLMPLFSTAP